MIVTDDEEQSGSLGDEALDAAVADRARERIASGVAGLTQAAGVGIFVDVVMPPPRLVIFGAGAHAMALCRLTRAAGWRPIVVDPRVPFATEERFPGAEAIVHAWPADAVRAIGGLDRDTCVVVLTHDPKLDDAALEIALGSDPCYVGAMGSRKMHAARRQRLLARGVDEDALSRLAAPVGLDLGGSAPAEVALAILAEAVAARRGGSALPLAAREAGG
jgi:xanthine dehydrogenase accessory factor